MKLIKPFPALATLLLAMLAPLTATAIDESDLLPVEEAFALSVTADGPDRLIATWTVAEGYYLYRGRTSFEATTPDQRETLRELIASRDAFENHFKERLAAGIRDGSLRKVDVSVTAKVLLGGLQWSIFWYRPRDNDDAVSRRRLARKMVDPLMEGISAREAKC